MSTPQHPEDESTWVKYELLAEDAFPIPDSHREIDDGIYISPDEQYIDRLEGVGYIQVLDWEYDPSREVRFSGPVEPIGEPGDTTLLVPDGDKVDPVALTDFRCERCGNNNEGVIHNGELQHPHECWNCGRQGPFNHVAQTEIGDLNLEKLLDPMWHLPETMDDSGYANLWDDVRDWIYEYWVAGDDRDHIYDGLAAFAMATWLRPNLDFLPHLMVMGQFSGGKTRLLNTLARISYRGVAPVSLTAPSLFRSLDVYNVTMYISEYHDLPFDLREEIDAVIKGAQKRGEMVLRAEGNADGSFDPDWFRIFSHIGIGTQYEPADDIVSRCLYIQTQAADRDIPMRFDEDHATELRNRLLYTRFRLLDSQEWREAETQAEKWLYERDIKHRLAEKLLSLVTLAILWDRLEQLEPFVEEVIEESEDARAESEDAGFVRALRDLAFQEVKDVQTLGDADPWAGIEIPYSAIGERFEEMENREMSSSKVGQLRKRLGLEKARTRDGTVIKDEEFESKLRRLCVDNNIEWTGSQSAPSVVELPDDEAGYRSSCSECANMATITHKHRSEGHHMCETCAEEYIDAEQR